MASTGWVVPKRRPELVARQIEAVLQMPAAEHERIRRQAVERVRREFNLEKQQREFLLFYTNRKNDSNVRNSWLF